MALKQSKKKIMVLAGGTGGHVMPALAVAQYLHEQGNQIFWLGIRHRFEEKLVPLKGYPIFYISDSRLFRDNRLSWLLTPWRVLKAIAQSYTIIKKTQPDVILSMGGYVSGPGAIAAWLLGKPIVLHEQNAIAGWTNRILFPFARRVMVAFPEAFPQKSAKIHFLGNPVMPDILAVGLHPKKEKEVNVLILGGSQGAQFLNQTVPEALALLPADHMPQVWHQAGKNHDVSTQALYATSQIPARVTDFIEDMASAYAWADIVICRSGALTIAELSAVGLPSILIPFPFAVSDHQTANAAYLEKQGGAYLLKQSELNPAILCAVLLELIQHPDKRQMMAQACRRSAKIKATQDVAQHCLEVTRSE